MQRHTRHIFKNAIKHKTEDLYMCKGHERWETNKPNPPKKLSDNIMRKKKKTPKTPLSSFVLVIDCCVLGLP